MLKPISVCCLLSAFFLSSCSKIHFIEFDPIYIKANAKGAQVYRVSYPKNVDLLHTKLDLSFNWDSCLVYGKATLSATPYAYPQDSLQLDAKGFTIHQLFLLKDSVKTKPKFSYHNNKISIQLDRVYLPGEKIQVIISYTASPEKLRVGTDINSKDDRGLYFINPRGKRKKPMQIWSQGETENNSCWFPTIENPSEKMTHQINITVDKDFQTISNGKLQQSIYHQDGTRTDCWEMMQPHAVYLTMLAVGKFEYTSDNWNNIQLRYFTEPKYIPYSKTVFGHTPEMIDYFSTILDYPFPWPKYDQIVVRDFVSGAMENTTASVFYEGLHQNISQNTDHNQDDIIAHELFHHWFGDLVTSESWSNLPLNEGFATYGEYLWREKYFGKSDADFHLLQDAHAYFDYAKNRNEDVIRFDYADKEQMFDAISYQKGALILHALRSLVGDDAFFASLHLYLKRHAYQSVEIHDLRLAFEEITGKDLNVFFNQWFLNKGFPNLKLEKKYDPDNKTLSVTIQQTQDTTKAPLYSLPLQFAYFQNNHLIEKPLVVNKQVQTFCFPQADNNFGWIETENLLVKIDEEVPPEEQFARYVKGTSFYSRYHAARYFSLYRNTELAKEVFRQSLYAEDWPVCYIGLLHYQPSATTDFARLSDLALHHQQPEVRAEAIRALKKYYKSPDSRRIFQKAKSDPSQKVQKVLRKNN